MEAEDAVEVMMEIKMRLAGYADEFRRGDSTFEVTYPVSEEKAVFAEIHIGFECPFTKKKENIIYQALFFDATEVDNWFNRVIKVQPYLIRRINRIKRD